MILIIGGAYQGKLDYALENFRLEREDVYLCSGREIDFSKACIDGIEEFVLACIRSGEDPRAFFERNRVKWQNSILICEDIFCGVVPMEAENRRWRQAAGRLCQYLASEADQVIRVFCGLEQRLK